MDNFQKWGDKGLYSCTLVVAVLRVKIGSFWCCYVTSQQLLILAVLLATRWLFLACSRLRRVRSGCAMTLACAGEYHEL